MADVNPSTMNAISTRTFAPVNTFCTRATRCTPKILSTVNTTTSPQATTCAPPNRSVHSPDPSDHGRILLVQGREEVSQVIGKRQRRRGDGRGESGEERNPAGHESPGGAEGARQVDVLAAGAGEVDAELGIAERAAQSARRAPTTQIQEPGWANRARRRGIRCW